MSNCWCRVSWETRQKSSAIALCKLITGARGGASAMARTVEVPTKSKQRASQPENNSKLLSSSRGFSLLDCLRRARSRNQNKQKQKTRWMSMTSKNFSTPKGKLITRERRGANGKAVWSVKLNFCWITDAWALNVEPSGNNSTPPEQGGKFPRTICDDSHTCARNFVAKRPRSPGPKRLHRRDSNICTRQDEICVDICHLATWTQLPSRQPWWLINVDLLTAPSDSRVVKLFFPWKNFMKKKFFLIYRAKHPASCDSCAPCQRVFWAREDK